MKPNDIYALPSLSSTPWYKDFSEVLPEVLNLEQEFGDPAYRWLVSQFAQPLQNHLIVNIGNGFEDR